MKTFKTTRPAIVSRIDFSDLKPGEFLQIEGKHYAYVKQGMGYKLIPIDLSNVKEVSSFDIHKPTIERVFKTNGNCRLVLEEPLPEEEEIDDEIREE